MNDMTRYTMPARSQGKLYAQRTMARLERDDEVDARGLNARDAAKAPIKATELNPHLSVCGWSFCLDDVDDTEGGAA